jgi:hypothetical protein
MPATHSHHDHRALNVIVDLVTMTGSISNIRCQRPILLDSGASCNFVDKAFAEQLNIPRWNLQQRINVRMANGSVIPCSEMLPAVNISLPGYSGAHDLIIMPALDGFDVVLGRPFLKSSGAVVDHTDSTVTWRSNHTTISSTSPSHTSAAMTTINPWNVLANNDNLQLLDLSTEDDVSTTPAQTNHVMPAHERRKSQSIRQRVPTTHINQARRETKHDIRTTECEPISQPETKPKQPETNKQPHSPEVLLLFERLLKRIAEYVRRMQPLDGQLPPSRPGFNHKIELNNPLSLPVKLSAIPLNAEERAQLAIDIRELEDAGLIVRSESEWGSPVFYVDKDGGQSRRLVVDYRALNRLLKRNHMTLPHVSELIARLGKAKYFTKLDLRSSYHQVLVEPEHRHMTAFVTPIGHYEWRVLPFGEANAPATFVQMMRHLVLADMTERGVADFVDDVLIYSETAEQHLQDVSDVLDRLEKHSLFIKPEKCQWMVQSVDFLGHTITATENGTTVKPISSKIEAVTSWPKPRTQTQLRSFLGFANTFRSFIDGFSRIASSLFDMLKRVRNKRSAQLIWSERTNHSYEELKSAIAESATLTVADGNRPFIVHTDASDYAIGAVLSQRDANGELRPIGFMSQKLSDVEYRWSVYEKELYSVVAALKHWSMWLMHAKHPVEIHNDHASLRFLMNQPKLTAKQTRWIAFLSTFAELDFVHIRGSNNVRADALSRRSDHDVGVEERQQIRSDIAKQQLADVFSKLGLPDARITTLIAEVSAGDHDITTQIVEGYKHDAL